MLVTVKQLILIAWMFRSFIFSDVSVQKCPSESLTNLLQLRCTKLSRLKPTRNISVIRHITDIILIFQWQNKTMLDIDLMQI